MIKGFTVQGGSADKPIPSEKEMIMTIFCQKCEAGRAFGVSKHLNMLKARETKTMFIIAQCKVCQTIIEVRLGWGEKKEGWTALLDELNPAYAVKDDMGLGEMHE